MNHVELSLMFSLHIFVWFWRQYEGHLDLCTFFIQKKKKSWLCIQLDCHLSRFYSPLELAVALYFSKLWKHYLIGSQVGLENLFLIFAFWGLPFWGLENNGNLFENFETRKGFEINRMKKKVQWIHRTERWNENTK